LTAQKFIDKVKFNRWHVFGLLFFFASQRIFSPVDTYLLQMMTFVCDANAGIFKFFSMQKLLSISIFPHDQIVNAACTVTVFITYKIISQATDRHNAYESLPGGTWCCSCLPSVRRSCSISKDWTHRGELLIAIFIIVHHSFAAYSDVSNVTFDFVSLDQPCSTPSPRTR